MTDYIIVLNHQFQLIRIGMYIRWPKSDDPKKYSTGGVIINVGKYKDKGLNWRIKCKDKEFGLYWSKLDKVKVRIDIFYELLNTKINQIAGQLAFLFKELKLEEKGKENAKTIIQSLSKVEKEKKAKVLKGRSRSNSLN